MIPCHNMDIILIAINVLYQNNENQNINIEFIKKLSMTTLKSTFQSCLLPLEEGDTRPFQLTLGKVEKAYQQAKQQVSTTLSILSCLEYICLNA